MELLLQGLATAFLAFMVYMAAHLYVILFDAVVGLICMVIGGLFDLVVAIIQWLRKDDKDEPPPYNYS